MHHAKKLNKKSSAMDSLRILMIFQNFFYKVCSIRSNHRPCPKIVIYEIIPIFLFRSKAQLLNFCSYHSGNYWKHPEITNSDFSIILAASYIFWYFSSNQSSESTKAIYSPRFFIPTLQATPPGLR